MVFIIIAHWRLSMLTQYLMWFDKSSTSTGAVHIIRDRESIQFTHTWRRRITSTQWWLSNLWLSSCCMFFYKWTVPSVKGCCTLSNKPNNHTLCHSCGAIVLMLLQHMLVSCNSSNLTILRASLAKLTSTCQTFQSPE